MAKDKQEQALMPSLIDRLIDPESGGTQWRRGYGFRETINSVRRDLEDLLNSRQARVKVPAEFAEVRTSIVNYGLPDFASVDTSTIMAREKITGAVKAIIERYEPRIRDVRAVMIDPGDETERTVRFHIDGRLRVDPAPEVSFETILELSTGHAKVAMREE